MKRFGTMLVTVVALGLLAVSPALANTSWTGKAPANASWLGKAPANTSWTGKRPADVRRVAPLGWSDGA